MDYGYKLTSNGRTLIAKCMAIEEMFEVTRVTLGSGRVAEDVDLADMHELINYVVDGTVARRLHEGDKYYLTVQYSNEVTDTKPAIPTFYLNEIMVYARDPETSEEVDLLYATLGDYSVPIHSPAPEEPTSLWKFPFTIVISGDVDVSVSAAAGLVTYADLEEAFGEFAEDLDAKKVTYNGRTVQSALEDLEAIGMKTFGVQWAYSNPSTELTRLTRATDPNGFVTVDITEEPSPAVGTGAGSSPFDNYMPWAGMEEYNIVDGAIAYARGDSNFSRTNYDTVVYIPEFYYRVEKDENSKLMRFYVSNQPRTGFALHPGSRRYVGKYHCGDGYASKSGVKPLANITRATARTGVAGKGSGWCQFDYATWNAIWLLYIVEMADWDSQSKVGKGTTGVAYADGTQNMGSSDSMTYHTGYGDGDNGKVAAQYRHIEDLWGNVYDWLDGVNFNDGECFICLDPTKWADDTSEGYESAGVFPDEGGGWISELGISETHPYIFVPIAYKGSSSTYIPDDGSVWSGWMIPDVGGSWYYGSYAGLFSFCADCSSSGRNSYIGARLLFIP